LECEDEEAEDEEYEYKVEDVDGENKKFKRPLKVIADTPKKEIFLSSREPFYYTEEVVYH